LARGLQHDFALGGCELPLRSFFILCYNTFTRLVGEVTLYIKSLSVANLRCFQEAKITFQYPDKPSGGKTLANVNLLLGDNGSGKSTVLKAIALAALSPIMERSGYVPYYMVRRGQSESKIKAELILDRQELGETAPRASSVERVETDIITVGDYEEVHGAKRRPAWDAIYTEDSPGFLLLGYSTTRRVESEERYSPSSLLKSRRLRYQRVAGLFEDGIALSPLGAWLPRVKDERPGRFDEIAGLMNQLLSSEPFADEEQPRFSGELYRGEVLFQINRIAVPYSALSDGYRKYVAWTGDLLYHLHLSCPESMKLAEMSGIVLLDEIDLHLHPEWQRHVVGTIASTLPKVQFIFSTHSPVVAGTVRAENILVMEVDEDGASHVRRFREQIFGKNADEVLQSSYFGLETTRAPGFVHELDSISQRAYEGDPKAAIEFLKKLTSTGEPSAERDVSA
jgi:hypothetical protein